MKSIMKRILISLGALMAAIFSLTNCTEEMDQPVEAGKVPYTIYANSADTKTVNNGLKTTWAEGDALNVFHAPAGLDTEGCVNSQFVLADAATGKFTTEALNGDLAETNDWYVLYPYMTHQSIPTKSAYTPIGSKSNESQTQTGNSNMNHIAGNNYPMWGLATGVSGNNVPDITMTHLSSLIEVVVKNSTSEGLTVSSVSFTAEEEIVGTYHIDFSTNVPGFTSSGAKYVSNVAKLSVKDGKAINAGESASFYLAIKPFTAAAGQTLKLSVNGEERTITTESDVVFSPGKIKKLNFTCETVLELSTIAEILAAKPSAAYAEGLVVAKYNKGFLVDDETGRMVVYQGETPAVNIGDKVEVEGATSTYAGLLQFNKPTVTVKSTGNTVARPEPTILAGDDFKNMTSATEISYIQYTGTLSVSGNYYNVTVEGVTDAQGSIQYPLAELGLGELNGKKIIVEGYFVGVSNSKYINTMAVSVTEVESTEPEPEPEPMEPLSGDYIVVAENNGEYYALSSTPEKTRLGYVTLENFDPTADSYKTADNTLKWTIEASEDKYILKNKDNSKYLSYSGSGNAAATAEVAYAVTITQNIDGKYNVITYDTGGVERILAKNSDAAYGFAFYKATSTSGYKDLYLVHVVADDREQLATPQNVTAAVVDGTPNSIAVSWSSVINATSYDVTCGDETINTTDLTYTFEGLEYSKEYSVSVVANGEAATYRPSEAGVATATTLADPNAGQPGEGGSEAQWTLVTDVTSLAAGDQVAIVCASKGMAMSAQNGTYRNGTQVTISDNKFNSVETIEVLTLESGTSAGTFAFKASAGYLNYTGSNNTLTTITTADVTCDWTITIEADGTASITVAANTARKLQWNANSPRFACYTSSQTAVSIFKLTNN